MKNDGNVISSKPLPPLKIHSIFLPHQPSSARYTPRFARIHFIAAMNLPKIPLQKPTPGLVSPRPCLKNRFHRHISGKQYNPTLAPLTDSYEVLEEPPSALLQTIGKGESLPSEHNEGYEEDYESQKICSDTRFMSYDYGTAEENMLLEEEEEDIDGYEYDSEPMNEETERVNLERQERRCMRSDSDDSSEEPIW
jgi:hypothetical protein